MEKDGIPEAFRRAFAQEDSVAEHWERAEIIFHVAKHILNRDFYRGKEINRRKIEHGFVRKLPTISKETQTLFRESLGMLVQRLAFDGLVIVVDESRPPNEPYRRSTKFTFKRDNDSRAKYFDIMAYFAQQANLDPKLVDGYRQKAEFVRRGGRK